MIGNNCNFLRKIKLCKYLCKWIKVFFLLYSNLDFAGVVIGWRIRFVIEKLFILVKFLGWDLLLVKKYKLWGVENFKDKFVF